MSIQSRRSRGLGGKGRGVSWQLAQWADAALGWENKRTRPGGWAGTCREGWDTAVLKSWCHDIITSSIIIIISLPPHHGSTDLSVGWLVGYTEQQYYCCGRPVGQMLNTCQLSFCVFENAFSFWCWLSYSLHYLRTHTHTHTSSLLHTCTHLRVPGFGLSPEQFKGAGVFSLDPPGGHHQVSIRLRHHHQVGPLNDASLDTLDRDFGIKQGGH